MRDRLIQIEGLGTFTVSECPTEILEIMVQCPNWRKDKDCDPDDSMEDAIERLKIELLIRARGL